MTQEIIKVLLIEDNPDVVEVLREELEEAGHEKIEMECAERLSEGLVRVKDGDIDVILLDITLPDSHGFDTFVKVHDCAPEIPIIILTNFDNDKFAIKAVKEGAQDYLVKGNVDRDSLVRSIRYAIERHRKQNEFKAAQSQNPLPLFTPKKELKPLAGIQQGEVFNGIYSVEQFRGIVERERTRVDQGGDGFSIVIIDLKSTVDNIPAEYLAQAVLSRRMHPADEVGWIDKQNVGILLHNTSPEDALSFSNNILKSVAANGPHPHCSVYTYPGDNLETVTGISFKRKNERSNVNALSKISIVGKELQDSETGLTTSNISTGGLFFKTDYPLPIGTALNISLVVPTDKLKKLDGDKALIKVSGAVIRTNDEGMAISFDKEYDVSDFI